MTAVFDELYICPKCQIPLPLGAFKRRSHAQGRVPSWCRACRNRQDRERRAHQRILVANECLRRIRLGTPPDKVGPLFVVAMHFFGGPEVFGKMLRDRLQSRNPLTALRAASLAITLNLAAAAEARANQGDIDANHPVS